MAQKFPAKVFVTREVPDTGDPYLDLSESEKEAAETSINPEPVEVAVYQYVKTVKVRMLAEIKD